MQRDEMVEKIAVKRMERMYETRDDFDGHRLVGIRMQTENWLFDIDAAGFEVVEKGGRTEQGHIVKIVHKEFVGTDFTANADDDAAYQRGLEDGRKSND